MAGKGYSLKAVRAATGREPAELLRELYVDRRHSQQEIADSLGVSRVTVAGWLATFGIRRDERDSLEPLVQA